jgi:hypothetical protein
MEFLVALNSLKLSLWAVCKDGILALIRQGKSPESHGDKVNVLNEKRGDVP